MTKYFKLIDAIKTRTTLNVARQKNGVVTYTHLHLNPNEKYELGTDEVFIQALQAIQIESNYSQHLLAELTSLGIEYTERFCKICGGRNKKISYAVIAFIDE